MMKTFLTDMGYKLSYTITSDGSRETKVMSSKNGTEIDKRSFPKAARFHKKKTGH